MQLEKMFLRFFPGDFQSAINFARSLPGDEISMAQLQGHFLKYSNSANECCSTFRELLQQSKVQVTEMQSIYDHLKRVGLEKYASVFEMLGLTNAKDCDSKSIKLADILAICPLLRFDVDGRKRMANLLVRDENFMKTSYAIADLTSIKEAFLAAYVEAKTEPTNTAVLVPTTPLSPLSPAPGRMRKSSSFMEEFQLLKESFDPTLENFAKELTGVVSVSGKSTISFYQLDFLLKCFPQQPMLCVASAAKLVKSRPSSSLSLPNFSLQHFLKRAGALEMLPHAEDIIRGSYATSSTTEVLSFLARVQEKPSELNRFNPINGH